MDDIIALLWSYIIPILGILLLIGCIIVISWILRRFRTYDRETYNDYARRVIAGLAGGTVVYLATQFEKLDKPNLIAGIAITLMIFLLALFILILGVFIHFRLGRPSVGASTTGASHNSLRQGNWVIGFVIFLIILVILFIVSSWNSNWIWIWTALSAIGTLSLAFLVVYKDIISKPIIDIEFEQIEPFCRASMTPTTTTGPQEHAVPSTTDGYWIRIRVINRGRLAANNCEGRLVEIQHGDGSPFQPFDPVVLHWVGRRNFNRININSRDYEYLDVLYTLNGNDEVIINCQESRPLGTLPQRGIETTLPPAPYFIKISISCENAKPISKEYLIEWNGIWNEIIMSEV